MDLPVGTITMLFSDVEGSTRLLARLGGERYAEVILTQRTLLRDTFARHHGVEMGTEGDSFFVVFASAVEAVAAAAEGQRALAGYAWPADVSVRVRMGLHTGEPARHDDGYIGMDVHRAARIASGAHGGQVVLSDETRRLAAGRLSDLGVDGVGPGVGLVDLGWHRFKDIAEPEHVFQLQLPGLPDAFPPLKSLGNRTSLPAAPSPLVGRTGELADLTALLGGGGGTPARLVTMLGPGGVGKTRLSLAVAEAVADRFADGVYFVPLAPVTEISVMWTTIAERLGVTGDGRSPPTFFEHIVHRDLLLVLDNLEQVPEAGTVVDELLRVAPGVSVLATSRRPLHVRGEREYPLPTLPVARHDVGGAVDLFVQYATMARPSFALTDDNAADVAALCARLDGLPLAIEIAAARSTLLSPRALLARLDRSLEFDAGRQGRPDRQRNLRETIGWSYDLLDPPLQRFFRRLGVLAGGGDLEAVADVACGADLDPLDGIEALLDASLVRVREAADGEPRTFLLQTIRAYARDLLADTGELDEAALAHATHYTELAAGCAAQLQGPRPLPARDRIEGELENMRAALAWCFEPGPAGVPDPGRANLGVRLCQELSWFWYAFGYTEEGGRWLRRAVDAAAGVKGVPLIKALHGLAVLLLQQGRVEEARDALTTALELSREEGDRSLVAKELNSLGVAHWNLGDTATGRAMLDESIAIARELGEPDREVTALSNLAVVEVNTGDPARGLEMLRAAYEIDSGRGNLWGCAVLRSNMATALLMLDRVDEAHATLRDSMTALVAFGDIELTIEALEALAGVFGMRGDAPAAARVVGTTEALREQAGMPIRPQDATLMEGFLKPARETVTEDEWHELTAAGRSLDVAGILAASGMSG